MTLTNTQITVTRFHFTPNEPHFIRKNPILSLKQKSARLIVTLCYNNGREAIHDYYRQRTQEPKGG